MEFVSFDIAKKLKEKGFKEKVIKYYGKHENIFDCHPPLDMNDADYRCSAPTISQILKWLREEKGLHIAIDLWDKTWGYDIIEITRVQSLHWDAYREDIKSYEDAALAGVNYCLENLI